MKKIRYDEADEFSRQANMDAMLDREPSYESTVNRGRCSLFERLDDKGNNGTLVAYRYSVNNPHYNRAPAVTLLKEGQLQVEISLLLE